MYDWEQTLQTVTVSIPLAYRVDPKKFESLITENYIKLNIPELKIFKLVDLYESVDSESSNIVLEDNRIIFFLKKEKELKWPLLEYKASKEELKLRRANADANMEKRKEMENLLALSKKTEIEKFVFDKSIQMDDDKRKDLKSKKESEKNQAEKEIYQFVEKMNKNNQLSNQSSILEDTTVTRTDYLNPIKSSDNKLKSEIIKDSTKTNHSLEINKISSTQIENKLQNFSNNKYDGNSKNINNSEIFKFDEKENKNEDNYLNKESNNLKESQGTSYIQQQTDPRQSTNIKVNLTEKQIPHFAARESLNKEPPYPKSKTYVPEKNLMGQEIEDRNPIWIKERADNFFRNKDYRSAVNAYTKSIEIDENFHKCYINRATGYIYLGEFHLAKEDLNKILYLIQNIDLQEREDPFYLKIVLKAKIKLYAVYSILNDFPKALEIIDSIITKENSYLLGEKIIDKIQKDKNLIELRIKTSEDKLIADKLFKEKNYDAAKEIYLTILKTDKFNEKIISNLSFIYLQKKDYMTTIHYCTEVLKIFKSFKDKISLNNKKFDNTLELKILLRRAESHVELGEMHKAQIDIESAERYEIRNMEILNKFNLFKEKLKTVVLQNYEKKANEHLKNKEFSEALNLYDKSVSLIKKKDRTEQLKFYLNRTSCLIALAQFENALGECNRILSSLQKQKNIFTIQSNLDGLKVLKDLEFKTYVKRAFVYTKTNLIEEAKSDYKAALILNPTDSNIKRNLTALESK